MELEDGWKITEKVTRLAVQSGSCFSVGYLAERGRERAFMKVFDFWEAMQKPDPITELKNLADTYLFERELLELCKGANKIVRAVANGLIKDDRAPMGQLFYLLFELADGDVRKQLALSNRTDVAWRMRCLHQIATALQQLHKRGIFHQDIKPSNVLVFDRGKTSKLGDLGLEHCAVRPAPHDAAKIPCAFRYA